MSLVTFGDTPRSVELLWTRERPPRRDLSLAKTTLTRYRHPPCPRRYSNPQTHALHRAATRIGANILMLNVTEGRQNFLNEIWWASPSYSRPDWRNYIRENKYFLKKDIFLWTLTIRAQSSVSLILSVFVAIYKILIFAVNCKMNATIRNLMCTFRSKFVTTNFYLLIFLHCLYRSLWCNNCK